MKIQSPEESEHMIFQWCAEYNLSLIIKFHNVLLRYLMYKVAEIDESLNATKDHQKCISLACEKAVYAEVFDEELRRVTFLLIYAHTEEWFFLLWKEYAPDCQLGSKDGSIQRFKPVLKKLGFDLSKDKNWQFLCDAEKIRNCLLHANGRPSLMRSPNEIKRIVNSHKNTLEIKVGRIRITGEFLNKFKNSIEAVIAVTKEKTDSMGQQRTKAE